MEEKETITALVHTYNSEKYLRECLGALTQADEILICDMHSTDKTVEIAKEFGARVIFHEKIAFADPARNWAVSQALSSWIFVVDSDEIVPQELWQYLKDFLKNRNSDEVALKIPFKQYHIDKHFKPLYPCVTRFFKKGHVHWKDEVHTPAIVTDGELLTIPKSRYDCAIKHYNYKSIEDWVLRTNRYTSLEIYKQIDRKFSFKFWYLILRPFFEFIKLYFLKAGFKQGTYGFIFSSLYSFYKFLAIIKLWEYEYIRQK